MRSVVVALAFVLPLVTLAEARASEPMIAPASLPAPGPWTEWSETSNPAYGNVCVEGDQTPLFPWGMETGWPDGGDKPMPFAAPSAPCWGGVPGVEVRFRGDGHEETRTSDEWGGLDLHGLDAATYTVTAQRAGFQAYEAVREVHDGFQVPLRPLQLLMQVQVLGPGGPLAGATVEAWPESPVSGPIPPAVSGPDGKANFKLPAGPYGLSVSAPGHFGVHAPRFIDGSAPVRVALPALPGDYRTVTGVVVDQDGAPVPGASVQAELWDRMQGHEAALRGLLPGDEGGRDSLRYDASAAIGEDGRFALRVPSGPVPLSAWAPEARGAFATVASDQSDARLVLQRHPARTVALTLDVTDAAGAPVPGVQLEVENLEWMQWECVGGSWPTDGTDGATDGTTGDGTTGDGEAANGTASAEAVVADAPAAEGPSLFIDSMRSMLSSRFPPNGGMPDCHVQREGEQRFTGQLMPGRTIVRVRQDPWSLCRGDCVRAEPAYLPFVRTVDLRPGQALDLDVVLRPVDAAGAVVEGYVVDAAGERGIPHAWVSFRGQPWGPYRDGGSDADGSYRLNVPPGNYEVEAYAEGFLRWVGTVDVAGGTLQLDLPLVADPSWRGPCCGAPHMPPMPPMPALPVRALDGEPLVVDEQAARSAVSEDAGAPAVDADEMSSGAAEAPLAAGGLGPYDKAARAAYLAAPDGAVQSGATDAAEEADEDDPVAASPDRVIPTLAAPLLVAALAGALLLVRRRTA